MKWFTIQWAIALFLLTCFWTSCNDNRSVAEKKATDILLGKSPVAAATEAAKEVLNPAQIEKILTLYQKQLELLPAPKCDDWFDAGNAVGNIAQTMAVDLFGATISASEEMQIGKDLFSSIQQQMKIIDNDARRQSLQVILNKLLPYRERKSIDYQIHLVESESINAFSVAGGHIHVTTGLLNMKESEAELAFIIGHEIAHVDKKHCVRKIQILKTAGQFGNLGAIAANLQLVLTAPFGQTDEYESDRFGAIFAHKAGYDAAKGGDFFRRFKNKENTTLLERMTRTHPFSAAREECLNKFIANGYK
jgi:beta-barrel assembly-enhancing protease